MASADHVFEHTLQHPAGPAHCRSSRSSRSPSRPRHGIDDPHRLADAVVRADRDRAPARLAGEPRAREGAAISAAASAPRSTSSSKRWSAALALMVRRPVKIALTMEEQFYTSSPSTPTHVPHQERRRPTTAASSRANAMSVERRRLRRHRSARHAEIRLHRGGALRHRATSASIRTSSTPTGRPPARCAASAFRSWCWAYESHTDMIARELGIDPLEFRPQQHPARRPPAGDRHDHAGCRHRRRARRAGRRA